MKDLRLDSIKDIVDFINKQICWISLGVGKRIIQNNKIKFGKLLWYGIDRFFRIHVREQCLQNVFYRLLAACCLSLRRYFNLLKQQTIRHKTREQKGVTNAVYHDFFHSQYFVEFRSGF